MYTAKNLSMEDGTWLIYAYLPPGIIFIYILPGIQADSVGLSDDLGPTR